MLSHRNSQRHHLSIPLRYLQGAKNCGRYNAVQDPSRPPDRLAQIWWNTYDSFARLHAARWTVGDVAVHGESGLVWIVTGCNGENRIEARGASQDEPWCNAVLQAKAVGMAGQFYCG